MNDYHCDCGVLIRLSSLCVTMNLSIHKKEYNLICICICIVYIFKENASSVIVVWTSDRHTCIVVL